MGEPAEPTREERKRRVAMARAIVEAVRDDERLPLGLFTTTLDDTLVVRLDQTEELAFALAQEIVMLRAELAETRGE